MEGEMRKTFFTLTLALCVAAVASVASSIAKNSNNQTAPDQTIEGFLMDKKCSANKAMIGNEACAKRCIAGGAEAVLATEDGKVYALDPQDKAKEFAGKYVEVTGSVSGDSISVTSIKAR